VSNTIRIGTRDSQLALWQATRVQQLLENAGHATELVHIKSEGDLDLVTPLYAMGVQGVFTKTLDAALLSDRCDIAVHSMKDVPTQLAQGIVQAAVLERASHKDILVHKGDTSFLNSSNIHATIATSSIRRKAQWWNRYPEHRIENLRGNVNTRLRKVAESDWQGAIFAAAGLERIDLRPENAIDLDWMLPAPAQGAIMIVCREADKNIFSACAAFNDPITALCTKLERDFLRMLMGGCATPISAFASVSEETIHFNGNLLSLDGQTKLEVTQQAQLQDAENLGILAAEEILANGGTALIEAIRHAGL